MFVLKRHAVYMHRGSLDNQLSECLRHRKLTRTGPKHKIYRGRGPPLLTGVGCAEAPMKQSSTTQQGFKMLACKTYIEHHNREAGIIHRDICTEYGPKVLGSRWETAQNVIEKEQVKIRWELKIQTDKLVMANQPEIVVVD